MENIVNNLISNTTLVAMNEMAQRFFWMNKRVDRMKSLLNTRFAMPVLSNLLHLEVAHQYPILADMVNDIEENFNFDADYFGVEGATEDYKSVKEMMDYLLTCTLETNNQLNELIESVKNHGKDEENVYWLLGDVSKEYSKYVANAFLLADKANLYGDALYAMDAQAKAWWKL